VTASPPYGEAGRNLLLAGEIAALLHDLGKLHPGFAAEKLTPKQLQTNERKDHPISECHGRILENDRCYPSDEELAEFPEAQKLFALLKSDAGWAQCLHLSETLAHPKTIQANGLGVALRQHHATGHFPESELSFLGDLYAFGADIRDSALDKGSGKTHNAAQPQLHAEIIDAFGRHRLPYSQNTLQSVWRKSVPTLLELLASPQTFADLGETRDQLLSAVRPLWQQALGETRRPTNDVTLWHHAFSTASFFKAALAEGVLRGSFSSWQESDGLFAYPDGVGQVRFRLLGIRWSWSELTRGLLSPVAFVSLSGRRREAVAALRTLIERDWAVGNILYEDDDGVLILAPGFYEADSEESEARFRSCYLEPLLSAIDTALRPLGTGVPYWICWSAPNWYLTDYAEALQPAQADPTRRLLRQVDETAFRKLWQSAAKHGRQQICPQCGLRPAASVEFALTESSVRTQRLCAECTELADGDAKRERKQQWIATLGLAPATFNLESLANAAGSSRIALFSVRIDPQAVLSGNALITQLARPFALLDWRSVKGAQNRSPFASANEAGDRLEALWKKVQTGATDTLSEQERQWAQTLIGDPNWLKKEKKDGRGDPRSVAETFFLRETQTLPESWGLYRHTGDRLLLFGMRKHPSPARLQRLWDDLRDAWKLLLTELAGVCENRLIPLSFAASGVVFAVAATDADAVTRTTQTFLAQTFAKVRGSFAAHLSVVVTRPRFPLYLALDALTRLEKRIPDVPRQTWQLIRRNLHERQIILDWDTPQGEVRWAIDLATSDPDTDDHWHTYFIVTERDGRTLHGPERLVHATELKPKDRVLVQPETFDFIVLEGSARRHEILYETNGEHMTRAHWSHADATAHPLLLDTYAHFASLPAKTGWDVGKRKRLLAEIIETHEKWVRDAPPPLKASGREAWQIRIDQIVDRYFRGSDADRDLIKKAIADGRLFSAEEWTTFIPKETKPIESEA